MFEFRVARPGEKALLCGAGPTRRDFLQVGALAAVGLSLPQYARAASEGKVRPGCEKRSCIMIFNLGGPSNMDLWDMKPDAPAEIRGPFKPIRTKTDAFEVSELLPKHAEIADKFSLVRSCHHDGADRHLVLGGCGAGLLERKPHPAVVLRAAGQGEGEFVVESVHGR